MATQLGPAVEIRAVHDANLGTVCYEITNVSRRYLCYAPSIGALALAVMVARMIGVSWQYQETGVWNMARIRDVDVSAKQRVKQRTKGFQEREPFRQAVANLTTDRAIELEPENGESLRKIKLNLARAAKEVNRNISYGETGDNMIVAWLDEGNAGQKRRRARRKDAEA